MGFYLKMDFERLIQNLFRILKSVLHQSCRELNFGQLLFWGQLLKNVFFPPNLNFGLCGKSGI
jgi:hypothetical protein